MQPKFEVNLPSQPPTHPKIHPSHLNRAAYVYVRQSSLKQVQNNRESQVYQYQLAERAVALGWLKEMVFVIDSDLGLSGSSTEHRDGYKTLLTEVSLGKVGIIFGYEVSRLARNNSDWYRLLDLAAVFWTLIADADGVYDPRSYNDRILLGLKGTMSEAELHSMNMRLESGRMNQVRRGEYRQRLPAGLHRLDDGTVTKDPDVQVKETIELVFDKFSELGSCMKVMRYLAKEKIQLPRRHQSGKIIFKNPVDGAILEIIRNPAYAGAFVYGQRRRSNPEMGVRGCRVPQAEWIHIQHNVYPAYISWQQYLDNTARVSQNFASFCNPLKKSKGAPRGGAALLQGLTLCGNCGEHMRVNYTPMPWYFCRHLKQSVNGDYCPSHPATPIDEAVLRAFFEAVSPAQINALEEVLKKKKEEKGRLNKHWLRVLKRAEYKAQQAQDRYEAVDARNRLVAETLESKWEESLCDLHNLQQEHEAFSKAQDRESRLPEELRERMRNIATSLPRLWFDGKISTVRMKELLRCLIDKVVLKRLVPGKVNVRIVWMSGAYWPMTVTKTVHKFSDAPDYKKVVTRIRSLWRQNISDAEIAKQLTVEGFRSPCGTTFMAFTVQHIRIAHGWKRAPQGRKVTVAPSGYLKTGDLAKKIRMSVATIRRDVKKGVIPRKYVLGRGTFFFKDCAELYKCIAQRKDSWKL